MAQATGADSPFLPSAINRFHDGDRVRVYVDNGSICEASPVTKSAQACIRTRRFSIRSDRAYACSTDDPTACARDKLHDGMRCRRAFGCPIPKGRAKSVHGRTLGETRLSQHLCQRHVTHRVTRFHRRREDQPDPSRRTRACSSNSSAASDRGTRCSTPAFMREPGMRHSRHRGLVYFVHVAPRASPDRAAVNTRNRRHNLLARDALEASTVASAADTSR